MKRHFQIVFVLLLALALAACRTQTVTVTKEVTREVPVTVEVTSEGGGVQATAEPTPAVTGPQEYVLGVVLPFTGPLGDFGVAFREGIELAVEQMNAQLADAGRDVSFTIVSQDTTGTPEGAAEAFQTVVQTSGAQVVVGPLSTSEVLGAKQFADENKITIIAPASSGLAGAIPDDFIFRVMNPPDTFGGQAFEKIATARGYQNVVILHMDDPFGNGMAEIFQTGFQAAGGGEVSVIKYAPDPTDVSAEVASASAEVARLSAEGNTAFFCVCFLGDAQKVLQLALADPVLGTVEWMGIENLRNPELLADPSHAEFLAQVKFTSASAADTQNPNTQPFIEAYTAKFNKEPGPFTNYAYDAANIAMLSILVAGNNGEAVQKVVPFVANHYIGTQVQTYLDENGDQAIAVLGIYQVAEDGSDFVQIGTYDGSSGTVTFTQ
jgi:branched-chain amino acid transport system substrate-binding protein